MQAGARVFEFDSDLGIKPKAGVTTQIVDTSKVTVLRRRMADYLTQSAGRFLKNYQNAVNSADNRRAIKSAILAFVNQNERDGMLPKDSEVSDGKAKLVDVGFAQHADGRGQRLLLRAVEAAHLQQHALHRPQGGNRHHRQRARASLTTSRRLHGVTKRGV
jgi:hypothetical protein